MQHPKCKAGGLTVLHDSGGVTDIVIPPIGFLSDHMAVLYDLDTEASALCQDLGINVVRAATVGVHPTFVSLIRELILERTDGAERRFLGVLGPAADFCDVDCCPTPRRATNLAAAARKEIS